MTFQEYQQRLADVMALKDFFSNMTNDQIIGKLSALDKFLFYFNDPALEEHPFRSVRDNIFEALLLMVKGNLASSLELGKSIVESAEAYYGGASHHMLAGYMVSSWVGSNSFASIFFVEKVLPRLTNKADERDLEEFKDATAFLVQTQSIRDELAEMGLDEKLAAFYGVAPTATED